MLLVALGCVLILIGVVMAFTKSRGAESAGLQAFKVNFTGQAWLLIIVLGVGTVAAGWWFDFQHANNQSKDPASDVPLTIVDESSFAESFADEPYTFGDDGDLDALWLDCEAGAMQACDDLYQDSPVDSEYEFFGGTCGLRFEAADAPEFCVDAPIDDTSTDLTTSDFEIESSSADFLSSG